MECFKEGCRALASLSFEFLVVTRLDGGLIWVGSTKFRHLNFLIVEAVFGASQNIIFHFFQLPSTSKLQKLL